ncbi:glycosyl transferase family 90-domain-containing protein [Chytriomyces sp. MP71]|nr:glycosyl transferase family 90-domain-containing protein [Chytriomyces sp. MP71]
MKLPPVRRSYGLICSIIALFTVANLLILRNFWTPEYPERGESDSMKPEGSSHPLITSKDYESLFNRAAPPLFDTWAQMATDNHCFTNLSSYDQIYLDLDPWLSGRRALDIAVVANVTDALLIRFENGQFNLPEEAWFLDSDLYDAVAHLFPQNASFTVPVNGFDEPSMVKADNFTGEYADMDAVFKHSKCFRDTYAIANSTKLPPSVRLSAGETKSVRSQHGFLLQPDTFAVRNGNAPLFSQATAPCFEDIALPLHYHTEAMKKPVKDLVPWEEKQNVLFWRGSTTGGSVRKGTPWSQYGRFRLMEWAREWGVRNPRRVFDASKESPTVPHPAVSVDVGFSGIVQWDDETYWNVFDKYGLKGIVYMNQTMRFKYLLVVDGNTWPSRLQEYLQSNSVVLYNGLFQDLYIGQLVPWVHYVPIRMDYSDLEDKLEWLVANDDKAKQIAINAQNLAKRWSTRGQFECYIGLLMMEYGNLFAQPANLNISIIR